MSRGLEAYTFGSKINCEDLLSFLSQDLKLPVPQVSSRLVAAAVQLDTDVPGIFSDNGFLLLPFEPQTITFTGRSDFQASDLQRSLTFLSMADTLSGGGFSMPSTS